MNKVIVIFGLGLLLTIGVLLAEPVEKIAAVVGNRVILASEVASQVQLYALQSGNTDNIDPKQLATEILDQMISDDLILLAAQDDTTITVTNDEIEASLQEHIASLVARFPSEQAFVDQLQKEGLTKRALEKRYRPQIKDQLLKEKIVNRKLYNINITRQDVQDFYNRMKDSLPDIPDKVQVAHILIPFDVSPQTDDSLKNLAEEARAEIVSGKGTIESVTAEFQGRSPGTVGGQVGFIHRDEVVPEFGRAAFSLPVGSISGPVKTSYGWHIIQVNRKLADSVDVSQILFPAAPSHEDTLRTLGVADSVYKAIQNGADFAEMAKIYSRDDSTRSIGGILPEMTQDQLRPEFVEPISKIEPGQVAEPVVSQLGYHIIKLIDRVPGRKLDINKDFDILRNFARQEKSGREVEDWINKLKKETYIDIRPLDFN